MMIWKTIFPVILASSFACCQAPSLTRDDFRFSDNVAGYWFIDQPMHALYEATVYGFSPDGKLTREGTFPAGYSTGRVFTRDRSIQCEFSGSWFSLDEHRLVVGLFCSDGGSRDVLLWFPQGFSSCAGQRCLSVVHSVDGDTAGWMHPDWEWSWIRCESRQACMEMLPGEGSREFTP